MDPGPVSRKSWSRLFKRWFSYPLDSDLSGEKRYPSIEQPGPGDYRPRKAVWLQVYIQDRGVKRFGDNMIRLSVTKPKWTGL